MVRFPLEHHPEISVAEDAFFWVQLTTGRWEISLKTLWQRVLERLHVSIASEDIEEWLSPIQASSVDNERLDLRIPQAHLVDWIQENYLDDIRRALTDLDHGDMVVRFFPPEETSGNPRKRKSSSGGAKRNGVNDCRSLFSQGRISPSRR